jgi:hypothetical protein
LTAGVLEMLVFAVVDPTELHWLGAPLEVSRSGVYALAFFVFWACTFGSSALTTLLSMSPFEVNRCPLPATDRPDGARSKSGHPLPTELERVTFSLTFPGAEP